MYENLRQGLEVKGYSNNDVASLLEVTPKTIRSKIDGKTPFTLPEVKKIMKFIFPEYTMSYIFKETNTNPKAG